LVKAGQTSWVALRTVKVYYRFKRFKRAFLKAFILVELISINARNTIIREVSGTFLAKFKTIRARFGIP
jgi:hypothetical protein